MADLEEERRKLRMEMKFRAKYHGQHALEMGLTPHQLLLVEQYVDDIKHNRNDEARLVDQLQKRVSRTHSAGNHGQLGELVPCIHFYHVDIGTLLLFGMFYAAD